MMYDSLRLQVYKIVSTKHRMNDFVDEYNFVLDGKGSRSHQASNYGGDRTDDVSSPSTSSRNCHYNEPSVKSTSQSVQVRSYVRFVSSVVRGFATFEVEFMSSPLSNSKLGCRRETARCCLYKLIGRQCCYEYFLF